MHMNEKKNVGWFLLLNCPTVHKPEDLCFLFQGSFLYLDRHNNLWIGLIVIFILDPGTIVPTYGAGLTGLIGSIAFSVSTCPLVPRSGGRVCVHLPACAPGHLALPFHNSIACKAVGLDRRASSHGRRVRVPLFPLCFCRKKINCVRLHSSRVYAGIAGKCICYS